MANPATIADLEARWRTLTADETGRAVAYLADAWWMLLGRRPNLEADITAGTVSVGNVVRVVSAMVLRVMSNPDGLLEEQIDDYRYRRDSLVASGALHVTADEMADITPGRRRQRSVRLVAYGEY